MAEELPLIQLKNNGELNRSYNFFNRKKKEEDKEKERNKKATAKKASKGGSSGGPFGFLKTTNDWLEDCPERIIAAYDNFIGDGENLAQSKVDKFCAWLAWKVNIAIERKRQTILKILHEQYQTTAAGKVMAVANAIKKFCNDPIGAIGSFAGAIFGPVAAVFKWVVELASEILRLAANLAKIMAALPPTPPNPHINYDKFKLKVNSISMAEIASDPSSLPPPEVMFPEPPKPFTKETFTEGFESSSANLKSQQKKYTLSDEDKKALMGFSVSQYSLEEALIEETNVGIPNSI